MMHRFPMRSSWFFKMIKLESFKNIRKWAKLSSILMKRHSLQHWKVMTWEVSNIVCIICWLFIAIITRRAKTYWEWLFQSSSIFTTHRLDWPKWRKSRRFLGEIHISSRLKQRWMKSVWIGTSLSNSITTWRVKSLFPKESWQWV